MSHFPAWQTIPGGDAPVTRTDIWIALAIAWLLPLALALTVGRLPGFEVLLLFGIGAMFAPFILPIGVLLGLSALRRGRAGWLIALLAGGVAAHLFILVVIALDDGLSAVITLASHGAALAFAPVGMTYAALLWATLYLRRPSAFIGPVGDAS